MAVRFNHTIVAARDRAESARFLREIVEAAEAPSWGPFTNLLLDGGVLIQFADLPVDAYPEIQNQHYAFLVDHDLVDRAYARLRERGVLHWADPQTLIHRAIEP
jgi:hypothetical protein